MSRPVRIGTRRSPLALAQTRDVIAQLQAAHPQAVFELVEVVTKGDRDMRSLKSIGQRGLFAAELVQALTAGEIDAAVHSSKDLPYDGVLTDDHPLVAWLPREDGRDALISRHTGLSELASGDVIATSSVRRQALVQAARSDVSCADIRGNVATRIATAHERGDAGLILAMAGLNRLGITGESSEVPAGWKIVPLSVEVCVPEAGQGAVVVQARAALAGVDWSAIDDLNTRRTVTLERGIADLLGGGCEHPIGVHIDLANGTVYLAAAASTTAPAQIAVINVMGLELAPLLSVSDAADIADAVHSIAPRIVEMAREQLPAEVLA